uniref:C-type lectin domain-containing protein n=1 Tax=Rhabditophanes sp. KR3021 TaxID=114890 RepID=A0AC35TSL1_9BILA
MDVTISEESLLPLPSDQDCVFGPSTSIKKTKSLSPDTKADINAQEKGFQILKKYRERIKYSGMDQIIPNLFVGSLHDSLDDFQLTKYKIKRIVSIMTTFPQNDLPQHKNIKVLRIKIEDSSSEDVINHFPPVCEFIHAARLENEAVLIHCFMGNTEYDYQETPKVDCCDKMKDAIEVNTSKKIIEIETKFMDKIKIIENMMHDKIRRIEIRIENDQKKREKHFKLMTKKTNLFNGYEYIYVDEKADWYSAQSNCVVWGGNLVSIHSEQENEFVRRLNKNVIWSGLNDIQNESVWVYSDGTSARAFFNWKLNQPDNSEFNENCVEIDNFGKMSDIFCFMSRNYICKR